MELVNTEILRKLISSTSKTQNKKASIQITEGLTNHLINSYNLKLNSNKWIDGEKILKDFAFDTIRFFNDMDYCTFKENSFKIRLFQRFLKYTDQNGLLKKKPFKHALTFKFQNLSLKR